ncbi:hypothetical protein CDAR_261441 [Caerostris darwini]|uniref:Uncharacterized protein n=1 Tax=Caerostris darwini TaxID=1538125 RepID=A0AAV4SU29_9ARAC|nr:hypothetical protein CDAR_261441 [Caerostris darwini]
MLLQWISPTNHERPKEGQKEPAPGKRKKRILCKTCCPLPSSTANSTPGHIYQAHDGLSTFWRQTSVYPPSNPMLIGADTGRGKCLLCQRDCLPCPTNPGPYLKRVVSSRSFSLVVLERLIASAVIEWRLFCENMEGFK